ncbi:hypothetical protein [Caldalkalibacillus mannanilyticus]|uniref:UPF0738 family protein n=1 Tax=Caldalkalibacillus mannanilyticus TaxID=1418 RepID=UPI000469E18F|nr:hypothetical protein [Caldalkalibacillus mannanilyticus]
MNNTHFIIERIEDKNAFIKLCYLEKSFYLEKQEEEWIPMSRLLVDSDEKQLIYIVEVGQEWKYIRFPLSVWKSLDEVIAKEQDLFLVLSLTEEGEVHKSIPLKDFSQEGRELIRNMLNNMNYGEGMSSIIEEEFSETIK